MDRQTEHKSDDVGRVKGASTAVAIARRLRLACSSSEQRLDTDNDKPPRVTRSHCGALRMQATSQNGIRRDNAALRFSRRSPFP